MRFLCSSVSILQFLLVVSCTKIDLDSFQSQILDQHNEYRREEKASNMCLMKWNDTLAAAASRWAERCEFKHEMKSKLGENLAFDTRKYETSKLLDGLMTGWHDEKRMWKYGSHSCGFACHFTQLVWHSTNTVGCAATRCPSMSGMMGSISNAFYLVCFYYPRGNWMGQVAYIPGKACSKCDDGSTCSQELCDSSGSGRNVAAAPAPLAIRQPVSKSNNQFSFISRSSRYETFSHGSGANRKTVRRGHSSLHRSGPHAFRSPQALRAPQSLKNRKLISQGDQGTDLRRSNRVRQLYSKSSQEVNQRVQRKGKPKHRAGRSRCKDRLPACWKWADRCGSNRAMKVMCPKSCDACELVLAMVDGRQRNKVNGQSNVLQKQEVRSGTVGQRRGNANGASQRHQNLDTVRPRGRGHHNRQQQRRGGHGNRRTQHPSQHNSRTSYAARTQNSRKQHLKHKQTTSTAHRKQQNSVLPQRNNPFCTDSASFATRCGYWAKSGFCNENYMMRDMYCKKTCGSC